jgi:transposase
MQQATRPVTLRDIAAEAGVSYCTASHCLNNTRTNAYSKATQEKVLAIAHKRGYDRTASLRSCAKIAQDAKKAKRSNIPANSVFESRTAETAAMTALRAQGHSNAEIAHSCGVCRYTVKKRIGEQPAELTHANKKLAGAIRSAKCRIKKAYQAQQQIAQYNELAAKLNKQLEEAKATATQLKAIQSSAKKAAKITGMQLVTVSNIVQ